jgi:hypothetical protein
MKDWGVTTLVPDDRVDQAGWYAAGTAEFGGRVECVVPRGYLAYARILHPATGPDGVRVRWAEVAAATGTVLHPLAQFTSLAGRFQPDQDGGIGWPGTNPADGTLLVDQLRTLCQILAGHTATPDHCWLTVWEGWGNLPMEWRRSAPRITVPHRAYFLFHRSLDEVLEFSADVHNIHDESPSANRVVSRFSVLPADSSAPPARDEPPIHIQSPSQWWPDDRAWCVATEIDFDSTLVGGSEALIEDIVRAPTLEAFRVNEIDDLTIRGDPINPIPHRS